MLSYPVLPRLYSHFMILNASSCPALAACTTLAHKISCCYNFCNRMGLNISLNTVNSTHCCSGAILIMRGPTQIVVKISREFLITKWSYESDSYFGPLPHADSRYLYRLSAASHQHLTLLDANTLPKFRVASGNIEKKSRMERVWFYHLPKQG